MKKVYLSFDKSHWDHVNALETAGYRVASTAQVGYGFPDITVLSKSGIVVIIEIKEPIGTMKRSQMKFFKEWTPGPVHVSRSVEQTLEIMRFYDQQTISYFPISHIKINEADRRRALDERKATIGGANKDYRKTEGDHSLPTRTDIKDRIAVFGRKRRKKD